MIATGTRDPITRQRSEWVDISRHPLVANSLRQLAETGMSEIGIFTRRVGDGELRAIRSFDEGQGLHLSVSWVGKSERQAHRYPRWDELADARDVLLPADVGFVMHLPPASEYVAVHDTTFHLHQHPAIDGTPGGLR